MESTELRQSEHNPSNQLLARVFRHINENLHEDISYEHILDSLFHSLEDVLPFDRLGIAMLVDDDQSLRLKWVNSKIPTKWLTESYTVPVNKSGLEEILKTGKTTTINDLKAFYDQNPHSAATRLILKDGIRSNITCPLMIDGKPIGVMFFSSTRPNTYNEEHEDICGEISEGIATLIHKSDEKKNIYLRSIHDLNNPLQMMQKNLEQIERYKLYQGLDEESEKVFYLLKRNCGTMMSTIQSYLKDNPHIK